MAALPSNPSDPSDPAAPGFDRILCGREIRGIGAALPKSVDERAVAQVAGLSYPLSEVPLSECHEDAVYRLWRAIMQTTADPTLPLEIGARLPFGTYEVVDYLTSSCATVGSALFKLAQYFGLITGRFRWTCEGDAQPPRMVLHSLYQGPEENLVFIQYVLGVVFGRVKDQAETPVTYVKVDLALPQPPSKTRHEQFFGCPVTYGAEYSTVALSKASWHTKLVRRESGLAQVLERHAQVLMSRIRDEDLSMASVRTAIQGQLCGSPPKLEDVAKAIATSPRTLQRRLQEAQTSFKALVDEERGAAARIYLTDPQLANSEIAYLLGYSEASAFARAFRRWTGRTPKEFRDAAAAKA